MKKTYLFLFIMVMIFSITISAQPYHSISKIVPEEAQWVIHLDIQKFISTEIGTWIKDNKIRKFGLFNTFLQEKLKVDILKDLHYVTAIGLGNGSHEAIVLVQGNMDKKHLLSFLELSPDHTKSSYGKYTMHKWKNSEAGVFVNDKLLIIGRSETLIKGVLDVLDGKKKNMMSSNLYTYWRDIPKDAFVSAVAGNISNLVHNNRASVILKKTGMALFLAQERHEILKMALKLNTESPETAQNIQQLVQGFVALGKMKEQDQNNKHYRLFKLLENINIHLKGNVVQIEFACPSQQLLELTKAI